MLLIFLILVVYFIIRQFHYTMMTGCYLEDLLFTALPESLQALVLEGIDRAAHDEPPVLHPADLKTVRSCRLINWSLPARRE